MPLFIGFLCYSRRVALSLSSRALNASTQIRALARNDTAVIGSRCQRTAIATPSLRGAKRRRNPSLHVHCYGLFCFTRHCAKKNPLAPRRARVSGDRIYLSNSRRGCARAFSRRDRPELCGSRPSLLEQRAQGTPGASTHPWAPCKGSKHGGRTTGTARQSRRSPRGWVTAYTCSPRRDLALLSPPTQTQLRLREDTCH